MQRDPLAVSALEHIALRNMRAAVRPHDLIDREQVSEVIEIEVAHRLEHRGFDHAALAGGVPLVERGRMPIAV